MTEEVGVKQFDRIVRIPSPTDFAVGDINSYVILPQQGSKQLVLIDTGVGTERAWTALNAGLQQFGYGVEDITLLLLTHAHTDHFGQAARIREASGCELWGHETVNMTISRYTPPPERIEVERDFLRRFGITDELYDKAYDYRSYIHEIFTPCEMDRELKDGEMVAIEGFELEVVHTPGHCPEEVVFWQAETRQMFSGDHLLPDITPVCLLNIPETPEGDRVSALGQYYDSADKVIPYDARYVYPSHGDVIHDHRQLIAGYKLSTERRILKISKMLEDNGALTPLEVGQRLFPKVWEEQIYAVISEVMGHLDMMFEGGYANVEERDGLVYFSRISTPGPGEIFSAVV